jgi:uridine kinase
LRLPLDGASEHPPHVRVDHRVAVPVGERGYGAGGVRTDPRKGEEVIHVLGDLIAVLLGDGDGAAVQGQRAPRVPEPSPRPDRLAGRHGSEIGGGGPALQPLEEPGHDAHHGGLLQHELTDERAPRAEPRPAPREVPAVLAEPVRERGSELVGPGHRDTLGADSGDARTLFGMTRWAPAKADILAELADEIRHNYGSGRSILAVDGLTGSGTAALADDLAGAFRTAGSQVMRVPMADYLRADASPSSAQSYYDTAYDYDSFRSSLVTPFRAGGSGPEGDAVLIVDGVFLLRPELAGVWQSTVCLFVPAEDAFGRASLDSASIRADAERLYLHRVDPRRKALANIDNTDPDHPRRTFSDSC